MDQNLDDLVLNSELGLELMRLHANTDDCSLDPTNIKDIIVTCEDTRIATRLSEIQSEGLHPIELERRSTIIRDSRLNMRGGQQCVRDFFVLLNENLLNWPDVYSLFSFSIVSSTTCSRCKAISSSETTQIYEEVEVPPNDSTLSEIVENLFNGSSTVHTSCNDGCKVPGEAMKRTTLKSTQDSQFIILIFSRAVDSGQGYQLLSNNFVSTGNINIRYGKFIMRFMMIFFFFRDFQGMDATYKAVSVLEFRGSINSSGESQGHYICDVQDKSTTSWFRTNDNSFPISINQDQVSKKAYVVLLKRSNE